MRYDAELRRHNEVLRRAVAVRPDDRVLDVGCGAGLTTREAARAASAGSVLGVDVSAAAIGQAREQARAEGLGNVGFEVADAQTHPFPAGSFDLVMSKFGTMFFGDPAAAFANLGRAVRPGGRLVMMVWQSAESNEWAVTIRQSLGITSPGAFSLGDPAVVRGLLEPAGFGEVAFADVAEPVCYGPDVAAALDWVHSFATPPDAAAEERLRRAMADHQTGDGVWLGSRAWIIRARRR